MFDFKDYVPSPKITTFYQKQRIVFKDSGTLKSIIFCLFTCFYLAVGRKGALTQYLMQIKNHFLPTRKQLKRDFKEILLSVFVSISHLAEDEFGQIVVADKQGNFSDDFLNRIIDRAELKKQSLSMFFLALYTEIYFLAGKPTEFHGGLLHVDDCQIVFRSYYDQKKEELGIPQLLSELDKPEGWIVAESPI